MNEGRSGYSCQDRAPVIRSAILALFTHSAIAVMLVVALVEVIRNVQASVRAVRIPQAGIYIADLATYSQVASIYGNGAIYAAPERGIGHIYGPLTAWYAVLAVKLLGVGNSAGTVRSVLYGTYWAGIICFAVLLAGVFCARFGARKTLYIGPALLLSLLLGIGFLHGGRSIGFADLHPDYVAIPLLIVGYALLSAGLWMSPGVLSVGVMLWAVAMWFAYPSFMLAASGFAPLLIAQNGMDWKRWSVTVAAAVAGLAVMAAYYVQSEYALTWTILVPFSQDTKALSKFVDLALNRDPFVGALALAIVMTGLLGLRTGPVSASARTLFLLSLFAGSAMAFRKAGGGPHNFTVAYFMSTVLLGATLLEWSLSSGSLNILLVFLFGAGVVGPVAVKQIHVSTYELGVSASQVWGDEAVANQTSRVLDYCHDSGLSCYMDANPSYYAQRRLPFDYEACVVWELSQSARYRDEVVNAMVEDAKEARWDIVMLRLGPDIRAWGRRCLPDEFVREIEAGYLKAMTIEHPINGDLSVDVFVKGEEILSKVQGLGLGSKPNSGMQPIGEGL